jgi:amino acid transporter
MPGAGPITSAAGVPDHRVVGPAGRGSLTAAAFVGLTVTATGGPLALAALNVPNLLGDAYHSAGLVAVLGAVLFLPVFLVWLRYSSRVVSAGGLYAFVEAAVGRPVAMVQAGLWIVSYLLYLVCTVSYLAYDLLPAMFPAVVPVRAVLQLAIPVAIAAVVLLPLRLSALVIGAVAVGQLALTVVLAVVATGHLGAGAASFRPSASPSDVVLAGGNTALLFICASLPLFLAAQVRGGSRVVRRGLSVGWVLVAGAVSLALVPLAAADPTVLAADVPGVALVQQAGLPVLAAVVEVGVAVSVAGVIALEFLALSRLLGALTGRRVPVLSRLLAVVLVAGSAASLVNPMQSYALLLKPSLVALWLAQLIVVAVYPWFVARRRRIRLPDLALASGASALMLFGLWSTVVNQLGT